MVFAILASVMMLFSAVANGAAIAIQPADSNVCYKPYNVTNERTGVTVKNVFTERVRRYKSWKQAFPGSTPPFGGNNNIPPVSTPVSSPSGGSTPSGTNPNGTPVSSPWSTPAGGSTPSGTNPDGTPASSPVSSPAGGSTPSGTNPDRTRGG
jgi:hypothetical protein